MTPIAFRQLAAKAGFKASAAQAVISGSFAVSATLTAVPSAGWDFTAGQWLRDGAAIAGATGLTYTQVTADIGHVISFTPTSPIFTAPGGTTSATVPGAPTIGAVTAGDTTAAIAFTAPASDGGSAITDYKATVSAAGVVVALATGASSPITVTGLTNGTAYTSVVQALNAIGYGPASAASASFTPVGVIGYMLAPGSMVDNWPTTYPSATWSNSSTGGSGVIPTLAAPWITLNTGAASTNYGRVIHRSPFTFWSIASTDSIVLDLEFPFPGPENGDSISVTLSSDNYAAKSLLLGTTFQRYYDGRMQLAYKASEWVAAAGEVFDGTTFNYLSIIYKRGTGVTYGAVSKQCIVRSIQKASKARPKVLLQFDLGHSGVYDYVKPMLDAAGLTATVNVTRAFIDTAGFMTTAQLQTLYAAGWDMAIRNGNDHSTFPDLASLTAEMQTAKQWNIDRGLVRGSDHCIYPVGIMTQYSRAALQAAGIKTGRTTFTRTATTEVGTPGLFTLPCLSMQGASYFNTAKAYLDDAVALGKNAIMYTHQVDPVTYTLIPLNALPRLPTA